MRILKAWPLPVVAAVSLLLCSSTPGGSAQKAGMAGWLNWRGPQQNGTSTEKGLPDTWKVGGENDLWHVDLAGGGTPVIANGKAYVLGYEGQGPDLQEVLRCVDAETGKTVWEQRFNDFLSDIVYDRYAIGSPTVDPETGNVYAMTSAGVFSCFTGDGKLQWQHSLMEGLGRLTFPNGRTGAPLVDEDLVIVRGITSNWGAEGPAADRFYAYDKRTGGLVWASTPGGAPKDNSFAMPVLAWRNGKRVFYTGTGDGSVVCVNARTGQPIWRYALSAGGMNASVVLHKDKVVAIHSDENLDSSEI
ncbi:MAG TPA: PQQ-binding-like beta-propeller repeat protein, partial [Armatimonadota bacterium]|nr:PQQ-binding-like beta-propeller repeat protein [Armatimonadota bacterium]